MWCGPFFRDHFARLDRQIVLIDVLAALNGGQPRGRRSRARHDRDLRMLPDRSEQPVVEPVRPAHRPHRARRHQGRSSASSRAMTGSRRSSPSSPRQAMARAEYAGAEVKVLALAAIRATREGEAKRNGEKLPCIVGYPLPGETHRQAAFRRQRGVRHLPRRPARRSGSRARNAWQTEHGEMRFVRFRPPNRCRSLPEASPPSQISASTARIEALIGDRLA